MKKIYSLLIVLIVNSITLFANESPKLNFIIANGKYLATFQSAQNKNFSVVYPDFENGKNSEINQDEINLLNSRDRKTSFQNTLELTIKNHSEFTDSVKVIVIMNLAYYPIDGSSIVTKNNVKLEIDFKCAANQKSKITDIYAFTNAYKIDIMIKSVQIEGTSSDINLKVEKYLELNATFQKNEIRKISYSSVVTGLNSCYNEKSDELLISWNDIEGVEEYELEYTFLDDYTGFYNTKLPKDQISYNFRNNSTRIQLRDTKYRLPLLFERGYVLYRIRAIGRGGDNLDVPIYCEWSGNEKGNGIETFLHKYYHNVAHMKDEMNWQTSFTFAEDGKRSNLITYFDGTFRQRQMVTGANLQKFDLSGGNELPVPIGICDPLKEVELEVIAGEKIYDYQGRPTIDILPTPTNSLKIEFIPKLNISEGNNSLNGNKPYNWKDFDDKNSYCKTPNKLKSTVESGILGSSAYYSSNNPNKFGFNAFLPDAVGFPFTQVSYLPDNTGRISNQSNVGAIFQFGRDSELNHDDSHTTKYYYATPNQWELDRIFGTDVGDALRYKKNAVRDANNQVAVSYINPEGKVVATCLAGKTPKNLEALDSQFGNDITVSLLDKNIVDYSDKTIITRHQFFVSSDNTAYTFHYSLIPNTVDLATCNQSQICLDCIYDFEIRLNQVESCNEINLWSCSGPIPGIPNIDLNCRTNQDFILDKTVNLNTGTYILTKKVTVNQNAANLYLDSVLKNICHNKQTEIIASELAKVDTMDCYNTCLDCQQPPIPTSDCDTAYCKPAPNRCDVIRNMMLADVSPNGQYCKFTRMENGDIDASYDPLSILNPECKLPAYNYNILSFIPASDNITTVKDLVNNWKRSYAELLLPLHPEYCKLDWCNGKKDALDFDTKLLSTDSYLQITNSQNGIIDLSSSEKNYVQIFKKDPWYLILTDAERNAFKLKLDNIGCSNVSYPADKLAMYIAKCNFNNNYVVNPPVSVNSTPQIQNPPVPQCQFNINSINIADFGIDQSPRPDGFGSLADFEWRALRSLYLSEKSKKIQESLVNFNRANNCNTQCIGSDLFLPNGENPCGIFSYLYTDKVSRFGSDLANQVNGFLQQGYIDADLSGINMNSNDLLCEISRILNINSANLNSQYSQLYCVNNTSQNICAFPSTYSMHIKKYLNDIFRFMISHNSNIPGTSQLFSMLPSPLKKYNGSDATSVNLDNSGDFKITINYISVTDPRKYFTCNIILKKNDRFDNWSDVKNITDINPDLAPNQTETYSFIIKAITDVSLNNPAILEIKGNNSCWKMNICDSSGLCYIKPLDLIIPKVDCPNQLRSTAFSNATILYNAWVDSVKEAVLEKYYDRCLSSIEMFNLTYKDLQYHYTLYYYDQAGNLVQTVPPEGVRFLTDNEIREVANYRINNSQNRKIPNHQKLTTYRYNTLNEIVWQNTPDAGQTFFFYDGLGRIVASQNSEQAVGNKYSYTLYDKLGRIYEAGQFVPGISLNHNETRDWNSWNNFIEQRERTEIILTKYDEPYSDIINQKFGDVGQRNLRKRISSVMTYENSLEMPSKNYIHASHFSYDIMGNVYKLIQDFNKEKTILGDKVIEYRYDLQSGKVNDVLYQRGAPDQFIHHYEYDALNRLVNVKTSLDGLNWETDARYFYYRHGPLARVELGTDMVQGLDYIYTLQGWIKGVNGISTSPKFDAGQDGILKPVDINGIESEPSYINSGIHNIPVYNTPQMFGNGFNGPGYGALHNPIAKDAFGYVIDYYKSDYKPIEGNLCLNLLQQTYDGFELFNGNISSMYTNIQNLGNTGFNYKYDQLNRLILQKGWKLIENGDNYTKTGIEDSYSMNLTYDADGNIKKLIRFGDNNRLMDELKYNYYAGTNRLEYIDDRVSDNVYQNIDLDKQSPGNYSYNNIGSLIYDVKGDVKLEWNIINKVKKIEKSTSGNIIKYDYDALGNRVLKEVNENENVKTYYVRDGKGNILSSYRYKESDSKLIWDESHIYGNSRVGMQKPETEMPKGTYLNNNSGDISGLRAGVLPKIQNVFGNTIYRGRNLLQENLFRRQNNEAYYPIARGKKQYELANHLGNVLAVISDRKIPNINWNNLENYSPDLINAQDYYPFGMEMPDRKFSSEKYEFGFNGKLNDNEVYGEGNFQDYGFRMYDTRTCRFISVDPLTQKYPELTPFQFANNKPINSIDFNGKQDSNATKLPASIIKELKLQTIQNNRTDEIKNLVVKLLMNEINVENLKSYNKIFTNNKEYAFEVIKAFIDVKIQYIPESNIPKTISVTLYSPDNKNDGNAVAKEILEYGFKQGIDFLLDAKMESEIGESGFYKFLKIAKESRISLALQFVLSPLPAGGSNPCEVPIDMFGPKKEYTTEILYELKKFFFNLNIDERLPDPPIEKPDQENFPVKVINYKN